MVNPVHSRPFRTRKEARAAGEIFTRIEEPILLPSEMRLSATTHEQTDDLLVQTFGRLTEAEMPAFWDRIEASLPPRRMGWRGAIARWLSRLGSPVLSEAEIAAGWTRESDHGFIPHLTKRQPVPGVYGPPLEPETMAFDGYGELKPLDPRSNMTDR